MPKPDAIQERILLASLRCSQLGAQTNQLAGQVRGAAPLDIPGPPPPKLRPQEIATRLIELGAKGRNLAAGLSGLAGEIQRHRPFVPPGPSGSVRPPLVNDTTRKVTT